MRYYEYAVEFHPSSRWYQFVHPPVAKTMFFSSRCNLAVHAISASFLTSKVVTLPFRISRRNFKVYWTMHSLVNITLECPITVLGPKIMKRLGNPSIAVPMYACGPPRSFHTVCKSTLFLPTTSSGMSHLETSKPFANTIMSAGASIVGEMLSSLPLGPWLTGSDPSTTEWGLMDRIGRDVRSTFGSRRLENQHLSNILRLQPTL